MAWGRGVIEMKNRKAEIRKVGNPRRVSSKKSQSSIGAVSNSEISEVKLKKLKNVIDKHLAYPEIIKKQSKKKRKLGFPSYKMFMYLLMPLCVAFFFRFYANFDWLPMLIGYIFYAVIFQAIEKQVGRET
jgi:hypothetical protein